MLRFENEAEDLLHYLKDDGLDPASRAPCRAPTATRGGRRRRRPSRVMRTVAETVSVVADPSPPPRTALPEQLVLARDRYGR